MEIRGPPTCRGKGALKKERGTKCWCPVVWEDTPRIRDAYRAAGSQRKTGLRFTCLRRLRASARSAAGFAFQTGSIANQCEVSAFSTRIPHVTLYARFSRLGACDRCVANVGNTTNRIGTFHGVALGRAQSGFLGHRLRLATAMDDTQTVAHITGAGDSHDRRQFVLVATSFAADVRLPFAASHAVGKNVRGLDVGEVATAQIGNCNLAKNIVEDRGRHLDCVVARDQTRRLKPGEGKGLDKFLQGHAVLQANRYGNREVIHQAAEGGTFLVHIDKYFAQGTVVVFSGSQINLVAADDGLLRVTSPTLRQAAPFGDAPDGLDRDLRYFLCRDRRNFGLLDDNFCVTLRQILLVKRDNVQGLREFRAVPVKRVGLQAKLP